MENKAFTLVELIVTISIVAIMAAIAIPSFNNMILNSRLASFSNDFVNSVALAKNTAVSQRATVQIAPIDGSWNNGWQVLSGGETLGTFDALNQLKLAEEPVAINISSKGFLVNLEPWAGIKACDKRDKCREITVSISGFTKVVKS